MICTGAPRTTTSVYLGTFGSKSLCSTQRCMAPSKGTFGRLGRLQRSFLRSFRMGNGRELRRGTRGLMGGILGRFGCAGAGDSVGKSGTAVACDMSVPSVRDVGCSRCVRDCVGTGKVARRRLVTDLRNVGRTRVRT